MSQSNWSVPSDGVLTITNHVSKVPTVLTFENGRTIELHADGRTIIPGFKVLTEDALASLHSKIDQLSRRVEQLERQQEHLEGPVKSPLERGNKRTAAEASLIDHH